MRRVTTRPAAALAVVLLAALSGCTAFKRCAYEGIGRESWQKPEQVVAALALAPGARVADLGSGTGYFTFRLADAVGSEGRVWAVDVDEALNRDLEARARREGYANVEVVLAEPDDPGLSDGALDLIFVSNTYHHLPDRPVYFARARRALAPGGRVAVVEYRRHGLFQRLFGHYTTRDEIVSELEQAGYRLSQEHDFLPRQSFLVFETADAD